MLIEKVATLTFAVDEALRETERRENRIKATVGRARAQLRALDLEHAGLEAEATELRQIDAGGGEDARVQTVSSDVEEPGPPRTRTGLPGRF